MPGNDTCELLTVAEAEAGERLDRFLARRLPALQPLAAAGADPRRAASLRDGAAVEELGHRTKAGETYAVHVPEPEPAGPAAAGDAARHRLRGRRTSSSSTSPRACPCIPGPGHASGTLVNALIAHCGASLSGIGGVKRPGIVHRLDKDTTGLLVVAKTDRAHRGSAEQFAAHGADGRLERRYLAIVWGAPERPRGVIDAALARSRANRTKIAVVSAGGGPARRHPLRGAGDLSAGARRSPSPACSRSRSRPAARTRCACTWPTSAIPCSAT